MSNIKKGTLGLAFASIFSAATGGCSINLTEVDHEANKSKIIDTIRASKNREERQIGNNLYNKNIVGTHPKLP